MLLIENEMPVDMEVLDANDRAIASMAATLHHLDGEQATLTLPPDIPTPGLHWGSRLRFRFGNGARGYEVIGTVIAHALTHRPADTGGVESGPREILLRLWECRPAVQRRAQPRRSSRFTVHYRPCATSRDPEQALTPSDSDAWFSGWCVDVSGGGMRVRITRPTVAPVHIEVRFTLAGRSQEARPARALHLRGRVLRIQPTGRRAESVEMAVKFECLSVEDGMALAAFLT